MRRLWYDAYSVFSVGQGFAALLKSPSSANGRCSTCGCARDSLIALPEAQAHTMLGPAALFLSTCKPLDLRQRAQLCMLCTPHCKAGLGLPSMMMTSFDVECQLSSTSNSGRSLLIPDEQNHKPCHFGGNPFKFEILLAFMPRIHVRLCEHARFISDLASRFGE